MVLTTQLQMGNIQWNESTACRCVPQEPQTPNKTHGICKYIYMKPIQGRINGINPSLVGIQICSMPLSEPPANELYLQSVIREAICTLPTNTQPIHRSLTDPAISGSKHAKHAAILPQNAVHTFRST